MLSSTYPVDRPHQCPLLNHRAILRNASILSRSLPRSKSLTCHLVDRKQKFLPSQEQRAPHSLSGRCTSALDPHLWHFLVCPNARRWSIWLSMYSAISFGTKSSCKTSRRPLCEWKRDYIIYKWNTLHLSLNKVASLHFQRTQCLVSADKYDVVKKKGKEPRWAVFISKYM